MNERIKQLANQAQLQPYYDAQETAIKLFAELIVRECGEIALKHIYNDGSFSLIPIVLNKHFGVEE